MHKKAMVTMVAAALVGLAAVWTAPRSAEPTKTGAHAPAATRTASAESARTGPAYSFRFQE